MGIFKGFAWLFCFLWHIWFFLFGVFWIFLIPQNNATHFIWFLLYIRANAYMHPYPNELTNWLIVSWVLIIFFLLTDGHRFPHHAGPAQTLTLSSDRHTWIHQFSLKWKIIIFIHLSFHLIFFFLKVAEMCPHSRTHLPVSQPQRGCARRGWLRDKRGTAPPSGGAGRTAWSWLRGEDTRRRRTSRRNSTSSCWIWGHRKTCNVRPRMRQSPQTSYTRLSTRPLMKPVDQLTQIKSLQLLLFDNLTNC